MTVIDRWLRTVEFWLPRGQRKDVIAELSDDLRSQLEDRETELGRPLGEDELKAFLDERGDPMTVAGRYLPPRYLIGPQLFPIYRLVLKLVFLFYMLPSLLVGAALMAFEVTPELSAAGLLEYGWTVAVHAFAIITAIFAFLQRSPASAGLAGRAAPRDPDRISRFEAVVELVAWTAATFWLGVLAIPAALEAGVTLGPAARPFYWPLLALCAASVATAAVNAARPRWTRRRAAARLALTSLFLLLFAAMLAVRLFDLQLVTLAAPGLAPERVAVVEKWANVIWSLVLFSFLIAAGVAAVLDAVRLHRLSGKEVQREEGRAAA